MNETAMIVIKWIGKFEEWRIEEEKIENVKERRTFFFDAGGDDNQLINFVRPKYMHLIWKHIQNC